MVRSFAGCANLILGYICARDLKMYVCAFVHIRLVACLYDDLDCILAGPVSDELVAMTEAPQQSGCLKNLLGVVPAPTNNVILQRQHRGNAGRRPLPGSISR